MVTIDLDVDRQWDELFRRVEAGEILRIVRGAKDVAFVQPADVIAEDEATLAAFAQMGLRQLGVAFPPNEFTDWEEAEKKNGTR
jgi:hypothetical protein